VGGLWVGGGWLREGAGAADCEREEDERLTTDTRLSRASNPRRAGPRLRSS